MTAGPTAFLQAVGLFVVCTLCAGPWLENSNKSDRLLPMTHAHGRQVAFECFQNNAKQMRSDLAISDDQTRRLPRSAVRMEPAFQSCSIATPSCGQ
jgi:hypothetical protein